MVLAAGSVLSWLAIGAVSRVAEEHISLMELIEETFSLPILMSVVILGLGAWLVTLARKAAGEAQGSLAEAGRAGFYFDDVYQGVTNALGWLGGKVVTALDEGVLGNLGRGVILGSYALSGRTRKAHSGDANFGLFGVVAGLLVIGIIVLFEMRVLS